MLPVTRRPRVALQREAMATALQREAMAALFSVLQGEATATALRREAMAAVFQGEAMATALRREGSVFHRRLVFYRRILEARWQQVPAPDPTLLVRELILVLWLMLVLVGQH